MKDLRRFTFLATKHIRVILLFYCLGGNDYEIFEDSRTVGHTVTQPSDTIDILRKLFTIL